jgi:hypothetical protein
LALGAFSPFITVPFFGSISLFKNGSGDGLFILLLAAIAFKGAASGRCGALWIEGGLALLILAYDLLSFRSHMATLEPQLALELKGSPLAGYAGAALQSIQLGWGVGVIIVGACLLIAAAAMRPV